VESLSSLTAGRAMYLAMRSSLSRSVAFPFSGNACIGFGEGGSCQANEVLISVFKRQ
jgi:hypothetical protein